MSFKLPGKTQLSKEQLDIINLTTNSSWVIEGGPGTGKTVMAFYRATQVDTDSEIPLLVYNRPLCNYLSSAVKGMNINNCKVYTYFQWIESFYRNGLKKSCPYIAKYKPDWTEIDKECSSVGKVYKHIIIDEAQDFPIDLIKIIGKIAESVTCFIDPNQTINVGQTDVINAIRSLRVRQSYKLSRNYRNTTEIRNLAALYCQKGDPPMAYVSGKMPQIVQCEDYPDQTECMVEVIKSNPNKTVGIICGTNSSQKALCSALRRSLPKNISVQSSTEDNIRFKDSGVVILNYLNMKGLEFDIVLLPRIEKVNSSRDHAIDINRMYVAVSRAVDELYIYYFDTKVTRGYADILKPLLDRPDVAEWQEL